MPVHWTQTPEGKLKMRAIQKRYARSPEGKRELKRRIKLAQAKRHVKLAALNTLNGAGPGRPTKERAASGRAMLVALARPEAARRIVALQREIEMLTLFLNKTKP